MAIIAIAQGALAGTKIIASITSAKPHDFSGLPDGALPGVSDDVSWPIHNVFEQRKTLDGGASWNADTKKTWAWCIYNPVVRFGVEDYRLGDFVKKLKSLYADGKLSADYDVATNYKKFVVDGRDLDFKFLDEQAKLYAGTESSNPVAAASISGNMNTLLLFGLAAVTGIAFLFKKG